MYSAIVFFPLAGFLIAGLFGNRLGARNVEYLTSGLVVISALLSWVAFFVVGVAEGETQTIAVFSWIDSGTLSVDWALRIDTLTVVMLVVVNTVSALVHIYSIGYMHDDPHRVRFFGYLSLFTFAMLALVTADNLLQLFFGWEGVGLASYLLIGFWYQKPAANAAAMKAFIVNRIGDFGFLLGIFALFWMTGTINLDAVFANAASLEGQTILFAGMELDALTTICLLLFMGAMGKSAQFLLHTWLPDAMEGPTPVSALIHAATMVTAGVFLVARMSPLFEYAPNASLVVIYVGAITAFFAATVALVQNDIKRVIAYSTCSQLGYMFVALGVGAYSAGMFHLFTHAFFKALLFLGAGSVIHAVSNEQDMRKMGGLRKYIPLSYGMMIVGTLALTGFPFTAGYFSKDAIIESAYAFGGQAGGFAYVMTILAAVFTSFYSWRLIFLTFHGKARASADVMAHVHESPRVMTVPLLLLAFGALFAGAIFSGFFIGSGFEEFWRESLFYRNTIMEDIHGVPGWVVWSPFFAMVLGFVVSFYFYILSPDTPRRLAEEHSILYRFLLNKWYFDEIYDVIFVRPAKWIGRFLWKKGDGWFIDGLGPDGVAARVADVTQRVVKLQSGYLYHYAFAMMIGVAALITWMTFSGGAN